MRMQVDPNQWYKIRELADNPHAYDNISACGPVGAIIICAAVALAVGVAFAFRNFKDIKVEWIDED